MPLFCFVCPKLLGKRKSKWGAKSGLIAGTLKGHRLGKPSCGRVEGQGAAPPGGSGGGLGFPSVLPRAKQPDRRVPTGPEDRLVGFGPIPEGGRSVKAWLEHLSGKEPLLVKQGSPSQGGQRVGGRGFCHQGLGAGATPGKRRLSQREGEKARQRPSAEGRFSPGGSCLRPQSPRRLGPLVPDAGSS